jgi:hypothetical protein
MTKRAIPRIHGTRLRISDVKDIRFKEPLRAAAVALEWLGGWPLRGNHDSLEAMIGPS